MSPEDKAALRRQYRQLRRELPEQERVASDAAIGAQLRQSEAYRSCCCLFLYISLPGEVDTWALLRTALKDGKTVAAPVCDPATHTMTFYRIGGDEDLRPGSYGIWEPDPSRCTVQMPEADALCLVPGFAFTHGGDRLGYGGGYYDRFLTQFPGLAYGLCRERWLAAELPAGPYDRKVDAVVTENRILFPKQERFE